MPVQVVQMLHKHRAAISQLQTLARNRINLLLTKLRKEQTILVSYPLLLALLLLFLLALLLLLLLALLLLLPLILTLVLLQLFRVPPMLKVQILVILAQIKIHQAQVQQ